MYSIKHPTHATARILSRGSGNKSLRLVMYSIKHPTHAPARIVVVTNPFAW